jgi:hypothetical protein
VLRTRYPYLSLVSFPHVESQVVLDVVGELLLVLRVQSEDVDQSLHVDALQIAVGEGADVAARLDDDVVVGTHAGGFAPGGPVGGVLQVQVDVAAHQVALACTKKQTKLMSPSVSLMLCPYQEWRRPCCSGPPPWSRCRCSRCS